MLLLIFWNILLTLLVLWLLLMLDKLTTEIKTLNSVVKNIYSLIDYLFED